MIRLHCLHAHPSNISYIDDAFYDTGFDLHHIVDSSFMERAKQDPAFDLEQQHLFKQPIVPIDEPLFEQICEREGPLQLVFSNPDTVEGTMKRLSSYVKEQGKQLKAEVVVLEDVFHLCLNGDIQAYHERIMEQLRRSVKQHGDICVMQLSMVHAAKQVEQETGVSIIHPLSPLKPFVYQKITTLKE